MDRWSGEREAPAAVVEDVVTCELRAERRDAAEHRRRILEVARDLFDEFGVEAVSMHQIAQTAGVGQGTLYRRYANKGDLCLDIIRDSAESFRSGVEWCATNCSGNLSALRRLDDVLCQLATLVESKAQYLGAVRDASCGERQGQQYRNPFYGSLHASIRSLLEQAVEKGEIPPLDAVYSADAILAAFSPDLYLFQRRERGMTREQILDGARRLYIQGLRCSEG